MADPYPYLVQWDGQILYDPREDAYDQAHLAELEWLDWQRMDTVEDQERVFWLDYLSALGEFIDVLWRKKARDPELV